MAAGDNSKQIISELRARLGDRSGDIWEDSVLYAFLNECCQTLAQVLPDGAMPDLTAVDQQLLVAAQSSYDLPTDFMRARLCKYKGIVAKHWPSLEKEALRDDVLLVPSESNPFWYIEDGQLHFLVGSGGPTQSGSETYELWYMKNPATMSDTVDPSFPEHFWDILETYAMARCQEPIGSFDLARLLRSHFHEECYLIGLRWRTPEAFEGISFDPDPNMMRPGGGE